MVKNFLTPTPPHTIQTVSMPASFCSGYLGISDSYKKECINEIYKLGDSQNHSTNVKGIMTSYRVWEDTDVLNPLINYIFEYIHKVHPPKENDAFQLRDTWGAIYKQGDYTISHTHSPCFLSYVYYLKSDSTSSPLIFDDINLKIWPKDDLLLIFPSYFYHSVPEQTSSIDRVVVAGNIDFGNKGELALFSEFKKTYLKHHKNE